MQKGVGSVALYNIIIIFLVITFMFLSATLSYVKAFKTNGKIAYALEKYEGYNYLSDKEIFNALKGIGYEIAPAGSFNCPSRLHWSSGARGFRTYPAVAGGTSKNHRYCLYEYEKYNGYFTYGIVTYVYMEIPVIGAKLRLPVYTESEAIFNFSS